MKHVSLRQIQLKALGEGNGTPLQYSCLENPMEGGAWWATVHGVGKSWTGLSDCTFFFLSADSTEADSQWDRRLCSGHVEGTLMGWEVYSLLSWCPAPFCLPVLPLEATAGCRRLHEMTQSQAMSFLWRENVSQNTGHDLSRQRRVLPDDVSCSTS